MRRYLFGFAAWFALALGLAAALARLVNPYGYWAGPEIAGLNRFKPEASRHLDAVKHAQYRRLRPRTLLAGNSRVEVGLDPRASAWPAAMRPVYNFGQPGAGLADNVAAAIAAAEAHRPDTILLGLDFPDFRVARAAWTTPYRPAPIAAFHAPFAERWSMLLSLDAVEDAAATVAAQHARSPGTLTPEGYDGLADLRAQVAAEGHAALFRQKDAEMVRRWLTQPRRLAWPGAGANPNWAALAHLAACARSRGIALRFFTYPYHEDMLLGLVRSGLGGEFAGWRRRLAAFAERERVPLLDFTTVDPLTTERVPAPGDARTKMRWYWEAGHFKAALGDRMIPVLAGSFRSGQGLTVANEPAATRRLLAGIDAAAAPSGAAARVDAALRQTRGGAVTDRARGADRSARPGR